MQVAYLVDDVRAAAVAHHAAFGSGPFFVADHIPLAGVTHGGRPATFDHSSAYGQWGGVMVELVCVHTVDPAGLAASVATSPALTPPPTGNSLGPLHHVARFVADIEAEARSLESRGFPQVMTATTSSGQQFAFHDGGPLGHLLEIYEPAPGLVFFYHRVAAAAADWDGSEVIRPV